MLPQPLLATALEYIFAKMTTIHNFQIGTWQRQFLAELLQVLLRMRGRVNFTNMARYSAFSEQTFRRHFQKAFRWVALNLTILGLRRINSRFLCKSALREVRLGSHYWLSFGLLVGFRFGPVGPLLPVAEFSHVQVLPARRPFLVSLGQHGSNQPPSRVHIWEDSDDFLPPTNLLDQPFDHICRS